MPENSLITNGPEVADVNRSVIKTWITVIVPAVFSLVGGYFLASGNFIWGGIFVAIFLGLVTLQALFLKGSWQTNLAILLGTIGFVAPYWRVSFNYLLLSAAIIFFFLVFGVFSGRKKLDNALRIPFSSVSLKVLMSGITGILLGVTILSAMGGISFPYGSSVRMILDSAITPVMRFYVKDYAPDMTIRAILTSMIERTQPNIDKLPLASKDKFIADTVSTTSLQLKNSFGFDLNLDSNVYSNITDLSNIKGFFINKVDTMDWQTKFLVYVGLFLLIWTTLRFIAAVLSYPLLAIAFIFFEICVAMGFAVVQFESRSREIVLLS